MQRKLPGPILLIGLLSVMVLSSFFAGRAELGTDGAPRRLSSLVPVSSISEYTFPELEND